MESNPGKTNVRRRLPLQGGRGRRLRFELRLQVWLALLALPSVVLAAWFAWAWSSSFATALIAGAAAALVWAFVVSLLYQSILRPLQTLSNVVASLREEDFSFRARGARRGDSLGDLALEINALASTLQLQRATAYDALTLAERVMSSMPSPVLAFDSATRLQVLNFAAERTFSLTRKQALQEPAAALGFEALLTTTDRGVFNSQAPHRASPAQPQETRWSVRRSTFRLHGVPHTLFVLSDVSAALREEERVAWQRLIRVLGHEINNSLTPIKSIAGSLRTRLPNPAAKGSAFQDFERGLSVIENRAESLNRFLQAYQQIFRMPPPKLSNVSLSSLAAQVAHLETRLTVSVEAGPQVTVSADPDQLQQMLINLVGNAADSALSVPASGLYTPTVTLRWSVTSGEITLQVLDNGAGLANTTNLFVPFYTTKPEGTGIGLILAQQIANAHGGSLTLMNRTDETGCVAEITLPA